jgi:hypothetical protein
MTKAVAEAYEKKMKRMMPGSTGSGSSSSGPPKYHMVYTPPGGRLRRSQQQQNWSNRPQFQHGNSSTNSYNRNNSSSSTMLLLHRHSRLPSGHLSSFPLATFHASTMGRWGTLLENATSPSKATHHEHRYPWSINRGANRRVLHHRLATPTTPSWMRFPRGRSASR